MSVAFLTLDFQFTGDRRLNCWVVEQDSRFHSKEPSNYLQHRVLRGGESAFTFRSVCVPQIAKDSLFLAGYEVEEFTEGYFNSRSERDEWLYKLVEWWLPMFGSSKRFGEDAVSISHVRKECYYKRSGTPIFRFTVENVRKTRNVIITRS